MKQGGTAVRRPLQVFQDNPEEFAGAFFVGEKNRS